MGHRHELADEQWTRLEPLLPRARHGPQPRDLRRLVNGILWLDKTGAPWRDLLERYGPWRTMASRYYRWLHASVWEQVLAAPQAQGDQHGQVNWELHHVDSTVIRAHQHAVGARRAGAKGEPTSKRSGEAKGRKY